MEDNIPENIPEEIPEPILEPAIAPAEELLQEPQGQGLARSIFLAIVAWIIPGLGHLFQRRIGRAIAGFAVVGTLALMGLWMRGNVFPPRSSDAFGVLGFIADAGSGIFYLLAQNIEKLGPDVSRAAGDYGTRLLATAGVLNLLFVLDALEISRGHKN
jgi:hypothetical protein